MLQDADPPQPSGLLEKTFARVTKSLKRKSKKDRASISEAAGSRSSSSTSISSGKDRESRTSSQAVLSIPTIAQPGVAIGITTIEDVIEELMGREILDETDHFADNEQTIPVHEFRKNQVRREERSMQCNPAQMSHCNTVGTGSILFMFSTLVVSLRSSSWGPVYPKICL